MKDPQQDFGSIRVLGTAGWIAAGLAIGYGAPLFGLKGVEATAIPVRVAAVCSMVMAIYSLTLPHTPPLRSAHGFKLSNIFPPEAFALFKDRNFSVFALASFLICIPLQFYYAFTNPFLNEIGVQNAIGKMTMGQMSELAFMVTLPWFFKRLGVKYTLMLGMFAWVVALSLFRFWQQRRSSVVAIRRHHHARHLLRLLLRHRTGLRRSESAASAPCRRAGPDHLHYLWHRNVCGFVDLRPRG